METDLTTLEKVRTRQRLSPDERIPQILDAALAEFTRCGFAAASVRTRQKIQSACWPSVFQAFWPLTTK